ncbi:hypothetical protein N7540_002916 [Penicillium herquei]|nr:hypothetical protein N7540_002916 [Penicillium herquei]
MDRYHNHRPPSSVRSSVNSASFNHVATMVTPPASPPSYPSSSAHLPHPSGQWPLSPPSTRTSIASATHTKPTTGTISDHEPRRDHSNAVIEAANLRVKDEQDMQNMLHSVQLSCQIWNPEIEPEHETTNLCECAVHKYWKRKIDRLEVQEAWSKAVIYPGEKSYHDCTHLRLFNNNPYTLEIVSPYGFSGVSLSGSSKPDPQNHAEFLNQTIALNASLDAKAKIAVQVQEPSFSIWDLEQLESWITKTAPSKTTENADHPAKSSRRASFKKALSVKTSDERAAEKIRKKFSVGFKLREDILKEEEGRWQNDYDRHIVDMYQQALRIVSKVQELRAKSPCQYLHLLRAGYFEPVPLAWNADTQASTPLRFSIDSAVGWRGITPAWRAFENTAEERLYWVLSNRDGGGVVLKPDIVSALDIARTRMSSAVEIPPVYHYPDDTCHVHLTSQGYSKQVKNTFRSWSTPISPTDETMVLLDVSGSMESNPARPNYNKYLITGFVKTSQPKNKELAKAVIHRFMKSMETYDNHFHGHPLVTFSSRANYMGLVSQLNINDVWNNVKFGGRTRIMTGWNKIKQLHFQKHFSSSQYHSVYGWQPSVDTPNLRLLVILDGEASDMDEFELELLSLSWAYVTIFLIGIEGSLNHHCHANRLQRMSEVNPRISFVEAQGNASERFILHELLKRHLGRDLSMAEFRNLEQLPTELASPVHIRQDVRESAAIQIEQVPVELPSLEETRHWQVQHQQRPATPVAELRADRDPIELPATPRRYSPFPPPERFNFPLPLPLSRPRPLNGEQSPQSPSDAPPPYFETAQ